MLAEYLAEVQDILNDSSGQFFKPATMTKYINRARRRIAAISACLRCIPDGARTHPGQEIYPFADWISLVQNQMPGTDQILACRSVTVSIGWGPGAWSPMWRQIPFWDFQARFRVYNRTFLGTISEPGWWAQFGSGTRGQLYLAPIPMQEAPLLVDLTLLPAALQDDNDPEPLPFPWTDAVVYWAGVFALMQQQRKDDAKALGDLFAQMMPECAAVVMPVMLQSPYAGGIMRSA